MRYRSTHVTRSTWVHAKRMSIDIGAERTTDIDQLIDQLAVEIEELDTEILAAVTRRAGLARLMARARMTSGGTRLVHHHDIAVVERYGSLGRDGANLATLLLRLGRR
jgi:chorismate mutase